MKKDNIDIKKMQILNHRFIDFSVLFGSFSTPFIEADYQMSS